MPDGSVYLEAFVNDADQNADGYLSYSQNLYLLQIQNGTLTQQTLATFSCVGAQCQTGLPDWRVGEVIPDGHGGVMSTWLNCTNGCNSVPTTIEMKASHGGSAYTVPGLNGNIYPSPGSFILGDNDVGFATDRGTVSAFNINTGSPIWSWNGNQIYLVAATGGGGLVVTQEIATGLDVVRLDSAGNSTSDSWTSSAAANIGDSGLGRIYLVGSNLWTASGSSVPILASFAAAKASLAGFSNWNENEAQKGRAALPDVPGNLRLVPHKDCAVNPRNVVYELNQFNSQTNKYDTLPNCSGPSCSWYVSEHQTNKCLADIANSPNCTGISTDPHGNQFDDLIGGFAHHTSTQNFTISLVKPPKNTGPQKPGTALYDVLVRDASSSQDYPTLPIDIQPGTGVYINGLLRWPGVSCP